MDDFLNGIVGFVISGLEWDVGGSPGMGPVVEETIGEGAAETLMEKEEQERDFNAVVGESIGVVVPVALHQIMGLHLA